MNGFIFAGPFGLQTMQALQAQADKRYISNPQQGYYPPGGIPDTEGSGVYAHAGKLIPYSPPLVAGSTYYTHILSSAAETLVIEDKYMSGAPPSGASAKIAINGTQGAGQTIIIRGNKFEGIDHRGIFIKGVDNIVIEGNLFDTTKNPIAIYWAKNIVIRYNKMRNHAVGTYNRYVGNHVSAINDCTLDSLEYAYNLVDRSDAPHPAGALTAQQRNDAALASDYINFRTVKMSAGNTARVHNNVELGSEYIGEAQSGCGFIVDHDCHDFEFRANVTANTTGTSYGAANSNGAWIDNIGHYTDKANRNLSYPCREDPLDPNYGTVLPHVTRVIGMGYYTGHSCDAASGVAGPHILKGNRGARWSGGSPTMVGPIGTNEGVALVDGSNTFNYLEENSFGWTEDNVTYPSSRIRDDGSACEWTQSYYYLDVVSKEPNAPTIPDDDEVYQLICGLNYVAGMKTNNAMFLKWGRADNHEMYFDESRTV